MESNDILNIILLFLGMLIGICLYMFAYSDANKKLVKRIIIVCISTSLIFLILLVFRKYGISGSKIS